MFKKSLISMLLICCLCFSFLISGSINTISLKANATDKYTAKSLFLMDYNTNQVLFKKNECEKMPVASIVKLMTICLTCEKIEKGELSLSQKIVASEYSASMGGSQVFIEANAEYTVEDLLKSTIVSSANDASVALAETIAGSEEEFVKLMNKKARELNLDNTNYVNCTGLPTANQFSCAKDTAMLLKEIFKYDTYHKFSTIWMDTLNHPNNRQSELVNTNKLIRYYEGCDGGKTGSTSEAGYCLAATAKRGSMRLIGVVLGAENGKARFAETSKLLNYGFANFENKLLVDENYLADKCVTVLSGKEDFVSIKPESDIYLLVNKHEENDISIKIDLLESVMAPINKGDVVGKIMIIKNGEIVSTNNIICQNSVEKAGYIDILNNIVRNWKIAK